MIIAFLYIRTLLFFFFLDYIASKYFAVWLVLLLARCYLPSWGEGQMALVRPEASAWPQFLTCIHKVATVWQECQKPML